MGLFDYKESPSLLRDRASAHRPFTAGLVAVLRSGARPVSPQRERPGVDGVPDGIPDGDHPPWIGGRAACAAGRTRTDADDKIAPTQDSGRPCAAGRGIVGADAERALVMRGSLDGAVGDRVPGRRENQPCTVEVTASVGTAIPGQHSGTVPLDEFRAGPRGHHDHVRRHLQTRRNLPCRNGPATDNDDPPTGQSQMQREGGGLTLDRQDSGMSRHRAIRRLPVCSGIPGCRRTR
jgi:hypothetical protein